MNETAAQILIDLFNNIDVFLIVFIRVLGFFTVLPVMAGQNIPLAARLTLTMGIALLALTSNVVLLPEYNFTLFGFVFLAVQEFAVGIILSFVVMMFFSMFHFVGQMMDYQMGFSMVTVFDPFAQLQTPITGNLYYLIVSVFFVFTGAMRHTIWVFFESFSSISIGNAFILGNAALPIVLIEIIIQYFVIGLRIAMPVVGTLILVDVVLGILVKAVPQMNVFVVGIPIKVFVGLIIVFLTMSVLSDFFIVVIDEILMYMLEMIRLMMPE